MIPPNIIFFGESGSGKSSVINMLSPDAGAPVANGVKGCTLENKAYEVDILGKQMTLWDTAGLDDGEAGRVPDMEAITNIYKLLLGVEGGIHLLVFVTRPRIKDAAQKNWGLFHGIICQKKVPIIMVVTGLEEEVDRERWWRDNKVDLHSYGINPDDHACITASRGKARNGGHVYEEEFEESRANVQSLLEQKCLREPWKVPRIEWFETIVVTTYKTRFFGIFPQKKVETHAMVEGNAFRRLIEDCGMSEGDADDLVGKMTGVP